MAVAVSTLRDVILRDGSTLRLRPPTSADADAVLAFFAGLSEESVYLRFHGFPSLSPELVEPFLDPDWYERGSLIGTLAEGGEDRVVALASFVRLRDPSAPRWRSRSRTSCRGTASRRVCSSSSPSLPPPPGSSRSSPR